METKAIEKLLVKIMREKQISLLEAELYYKDKMLRLVDQAGENIKAKIESGELR